MNNADITSGLKTAIENAVGLSYVKQVLIGRRDPSTITQFPVIIIEPSGDVETNEVNTIIDIRTTFVVYGALMIYNPDKQLIGDANTVGAFDFEDAIKKVLDADPTLGGLASNVVIKGTSHSSDQFPMREISIEVEVWFRQIKAVRT